VEQLRLRFRHGAGYLRVGITDTDVSIVPSGDIVHRIKSTGSPLIREYEARGDPASNLWGSETEDITRVLSCGA
jgi:hypothetical protein